MKYNLSNKVIFKTKPLTIKSEYRHVYYKIEPSELPWFKRTFCNPWRLMFHSYRCYVGTNELFSSDDYREEIKPLKTFGEVSNYLQSQLDIVQEKEFNEEQKWQ